MSKCSRLTGKLNRTKFKTIWIPKATVQKGRTTNMCAFLFERIIAEQTSLCIQYIIVTDIVGVWKRFSRYTSKWNLSQFWWFSTIFPRNTALPNYSIFFESTWTFCLQKKVDDIFSTRWKSKLHSIFDVICWF